MAELCKTVVYTCCLYFSPPTPFSAGTLASVPSTPRLWGFMGLPPLKPKLWLPAPIQASHACSSLSGIFCLCLLSPSLACPPLLPRCQLTSHRHRDPGFLVIAKHWDWADCWSQLRAQLCPLPAVGPWVIYLTSAGLSFPVCKPGQRSLPAYCSERLMR